MFCMDLPHTLFTKLRNLIYLLYNVSLSALPFICLLQCLSFVYLPLCISLSVQLNVFHYLLCVWMSSILSLYLMFFIWLLYSVLIVKFLLSLYKKLVSLLVFISVFLLSIYIFLPTFFLILSSKRLTFLATFYRKKMKLKGPIFHSVSSLLLCNLRTLVIFLKFQNFKITLKGIPIEAIY